MQRSRVSDTLDAIGDRISPERMVERRKAAVGQRFHRAKDAVMGSPHYVEPVTRRLSDAGQSAVDSAKSMTDRVQHAPDMINEQTRGNPLVAGLVAFGIGALVASAMPKSRTEQRLVEQAKPQLQSAANELKEAGRDVAEGAKEHAQQAAQEVKSSSADAASQVKDQAQQSAQEVREQAKS
jgi:hypothetical protein